MTIEPGTRSYRCLIRIPLSHRLRPSAPCYRIRSMILISRAEMFAGPLPLRTHSIQSRCQAHRVIRPLDILPMVIALLAT